MASRKKTKKITNFEGIEIPVYFIDPGKGYYGLCYNPKGKNPRIYVHHKLSKKLTLSILIEEVFHAYFFELPEWKAKKFAANLSRLIYSKFLSKDANKAL